MLSIRLYFLQRLTALIMAPLVLLHIGVMIYAIQGGLTSEEILNRTQGSLFWAIVYGLFVASVAIHGAIGVRTISHEWGMNTGNRSAVVGWIVFLTILLLGGRAVQAVIFS